MATARAGARQGNLSTSFTELIDTVGLMVMVNSTCSSTIALAIIRNNSSDNHSTIVE